MTYRLRTIELGKYKNMHSKPNSNVIEVKDNRTTYFLSKYILTTDTYMMKLHCDMISKFFKKYIGSLDVIWQKAMIFDDFSVTIKWNIEAKYFHCCHHCVKINVLPIFSPRFRPLDGSLEAPLFEKKIQKRWF